MRPLLNMYNLNLAGASASNLLSVAQGESSSTPRTPEILNSLIAMSNPFDSYRGGTHGPRLASSPPSGSDTNSTCSSGSPSCVSPPSVQLTCSKLIKEGLRHTLQTKRRNNSVSSDAQLSSIEDGSRSCKTEELTPEDEERRRRRRERNKIAATKCRMKKRERTVNLVQESEILETQNHDLKSQIQELEIQRKRLVEMLSGHRPTCKQTGGVGGSTVTATAANFSTSEQQSYHHHHLEASGSSCSRSSSTVETMVYQRVNIGNHPTTTTLDSRLSYRRLEVSASDYPRQTNDNLTPPPFDDNTTSYDTKTMHSTYDSSKTAQSPYSTTVQSPYNTGVQSPCTTVQSSYDKTVQSPYNTAVNSPYNTGIESPCTAVQSSYNKTGHSPYNTGVQSPYEPNYQSSYHDETATMKDDDEVWRSGSGSSLNTQFGRISTTDSGYSCQQSLSSSGMNSPMPYLQSDDANPAYTRAIFSRPTSLDVSTSDYDSNAEIVDSPTLATSHSYRPYDSVDSAYCANYVPPPSTNRGGCIS